MVEHDCLDVTWSFIVANETVLITGASAGIGVEFARLFAADGAALVLVARRVDRLETLAAELRNRNGSTVLVIAGDLSDPRYPGELCDKLQADGVTIDVLVNNAGFGARGDFADLDFKRQCDMVQVNVTAPTVLSRMLLPGMVARRRGGILNVASIAGFQPGPYMGVYYATKAFLLSFSEAIAEEVRGKGVTVSCLCPGPTITEFGQAAGMDSTIVFRHWAMTAEAVARIGYDGFRRGKAVVVPGLLNKISTLVVRVIPRSVVRRLVARIQK